MEILFILDNITLHVLLQQRYSEYDFYFNLPFNGRDTVFNIPQTPNSKVRIAAALSSSGLSYKSSHSIIV